MLSAFGPKAGEMVILSFPTKYSEQSKSRGALEGNGFISDVTAAVE
jgi:hypothetical protein